MEAVRALCVYIIFFNSFYYYVKLNAVCMATSEKNVGFLDSIMVKVRKYIGDVSNLFQKTKIMEHKKEGQESDFLKYLGDEGKEQEQEEKEKIMAPRLNRTSASETHVIMPMKLQMDAAQIIKSHGFKSETHTVFTSDGYVLTIHRIIPENQTPRQAVVLHHGLLGSSEDWLILGPELALPYLLVNKGYDVWLLNARGNKYSKVHTTWYIDSYDFWDFTWHEIGVFDLPATLTYITEYTNEADLHFIGHSMGSTALLVLLSTIPEYNEKLKSAVLLAPLAFMYHAKGPLKQLAEIRSRGGISALNFLGTNELLSEGEFPPYIVEKFCKGNQKSCQNPILLLANGGEILDDDLMNNILSHMPAGGSAMTVLHYIQLVRSGYFQRYNYGVDGNLKKYHSKFPPKYDLAAITLPISLFTSPSDWLSTTSDVALLMVKLQNVYIHHIVRRNDFSHLDFVWAKDAPKLVFSPLMEILEQVSPIKYKLTHSNKRLHATRRTTVKTSN
ncbi:lipase 3-like [Anticarsia gemmatalis]|uniref:lipase 3-like n=1 Tax=Anticarsia gemmatalis TaxID=129554 RepID=UPI003F774412